MNKEPEGAEFVARRWETAEGHLVVFRLKRKLTTKEKRDFMKLAGQLDLDLMHAGTPSLWLLRQCFQGPAKKAPFC